jgi:hypothetical protein
MSNSVKFEVLTSLSVKVTYTVMLYAQVEVYVSEEHATSIFRVYTVELEGVVFLRNACARLAENTASFPIR